MYRIIYSTKYSIQHSSSYGTGTNRPVLNFMPVGRPAVFLTLHKLNRVMLGLSWFVNELADSLHHDAAAVIHAAVERRCAPHNSSHDRQSRTLPAYYVGTSHCGGQ